MFTPHTNPLENFHRFVGLQLASTTSKPMSPEQVLLMWRERQRSLVAIQEGLADVEARCPRPADQVLRELRAEFGDA